MYYKPVSTLALHSSLPRVNHLTHIQSAFFICRPEQITAVLNSQDIFDSHSQFVSSELDVLSYLAHTRKNTGLKLTQRGLKIAPMQIQGSYGHIKITPTHFKPSVVLVCRRRNPTRELETPRQVPVELFTEKCRLLFFASAHKKQLWQKYSGQLLQQIVNLHVKKCLVSTTSNTFLLK